MKIAHLILAHKNPQQVLRLISALDHPNFDFYIHIDKKAQEAPFKSLLKRDNIFFIKRRAEVYWGGWGTIQGTLNGFETIIGKGYDYVNVISGQDFPIKSPAFIYDYFLKRQGTEFITCQHMKGDWADVESRVKNYHFINWRIPGKFTLEKIITKILPTRVFPFPFEIVGRANWFALSGEAVEYVFDFIKDNPKISRYFKLCWGADEFIFSTILYNSPFKERIVENLVYVDWNGTEKGHPRLLESQDINSIKACDKLFARKFDMKVDSAILDMIEDLILPGRN